MSQSGFLLLDEEVMPLDKQAHIAAGIYTGAVGYGVGYYFTNDRKKSKRISIGLTVAVGLAKEIADSTKKDNKFDSMDFVSTIFGGLALNIVL